MPQSSPAPIVIDGATELNLRGFVWVLQRWFSLRKEMMNSEGYIVHRVYYLFPFTLGILSFWTDRKSAYRFAHKPVHSAFRAWSEANTRKSRGGWLAIYEFKSGGRLWGNGVCRVSKTFAPHLPESASHEPPA